MTNNVVSPEATDTLETSSSPLANTRTVLLFSLLVDFGLTAIHLVSFVVMKHALLIFDLNAEANIPSWWSGNQLLIAGLLLALVSWRNLWIDWSAWVAGGIAAVLILLSLDEVSGIHERVGHYVDWFVINRSDTVFDKTGVWFIVLGIPLIGVLGVLALGARSFFGTVPGTMLRIGLGFAVLLTGAVGMEAMNNFFRPDTKFIVQAAEECFEMVGGSILLWASLLFACRHPSTIAVATLIAAPSRVNGSRKMA